MGKSSSPAPISGPRRVSRASSNSLQLSQLLSALANPKPLSSPSSSRDDEGRWKSEAQPQRLRWCRPVTSRHLSAAAGTGNPVRSLPMRGNRRRRGETNDLISSPRASSGTLVPAVPERRCYIDAHANNTLFRTWIVRLSDRGGEGLATSRSACTIGMLGHGHV